MRRTPMPRAVCRGPRAALQRAACGILGAAKVDDVISISHRHGNRCIRESRGEAACCTHQKCARTHARTHACTHARRRRRRRTRMHTRTRTRAREHASTHNTNALTCASKHARYSTLTPRTRVRHSLGRRRARGVNHVHRHGRRRPRRRDQPGGAERSKHCRCLRQSCCKCGASAAGRGAARHTAPNAAGAKRDAVRAQWGQRSGVGTVGSDGWSGAAVPRSSTSSGQSAAV
jgi:hypothetical protein